MVEINIELTFLFTRQRNKIYIVVYIEVPLKEEKNMCKLTLSAEVRSTILWTVSCHFGVWVMFIVDAPIVVVKCRPIINTPLFYFILCLCVMSYNFSCSFSSIFFLTKYNKSSWLVLRMIMFVFPKIQHINIQWGRMGTTGTSWTKTFNYHWNGMECGVGMIKNSVVCLLSFYFFFAL